MGPTVVGFTGVRHHHDDCYDNAESTGHQGGAVRVRVRESLVIANGCHDDKHPGHRVVEAAQTSVRVFGAYGAGIQLRG